MKTYNKSDLLQFTGRMEQVAGIRRLIFDDGSARGMRLLEFNNGSGLTFSVLPDRGMDIGAAAYKGSPIAWLSCNGYYAPSFYDSTGERWLRSWGGGLLTGCGILNVGGPDPCEGDAHGLHGRLSHLPAEEVNSRACWSADNSEYILSASGRMRHTTVFSEKLICTRKITTSLGDNTITVRDLVENQGVSPMPFMLLYHINLGWPLVAPDAVITAPEHKITPQNEYSAASLAEWNKLSAPLPGFQGQVYYHEIGADADGMATMGIVNQRLGMALDVRYRVAELPYLIQWKQMGMGEYAIGLEPSNSFPEGQTSVRERGLLQQIQPGESIESFVQIKVRDV